MSDYRPRISVEVTKEDKEALKMLMPHGTQKIVFQLIVKDLINVLRKYGSGKVIGAFIERDITLEDLVRMEVSDEPK